jgi:hypothetical protein
VLAPKLVIFNRNSDAVPDSAEVVKIHSRVSAVQNGRQADGTISFSLLGTEEARIDLGHSLSSLY